MQGWQVVQVEVESLGGIRALQEVDVDVPQHVGVER